MSDKLTLDIIRGGLVWASGFTFMAATIGHPILYVVAALLMSCLVLTGVRQ